MECNMSDVNKYAINVHPITVEPEHHQQVLICCKDKSNDKLLYAFARYLKKDNILVLKKVPLDLPAKSYKSFSDTDISITQPINESGFYFNVKKVNEDYFYYKKVDKNIIAWYDLKDR